MIGNMKANAHLASLGSMSQMEDHIRTGHIDKVYARDQTGYSMGRVKYNSELVIKATASLKKKAKYYPASYSVHNHKQAVAHTIEIEASLVILYFRNANNVACARAFCCQKTSQFFLHLVSSCSKSYYDADDMIKPRTLYVKQRRPTSNPLVSFMIRHFEYN